VTLLAWGGWQTMNSIIAKTRASTNPNSFVSSSFESEQQYPIFTPSTSNSVSLFPQDAKNPLRGYGASQVRGDRARIDERFEAMTPIHTMQKQGHVLAGSNSWLSRFQLFGFGCLWSTLLVFVLTLIFSGRLGLSTTHI